ncbi:conserved hypothetical protein [Candidatus Roizmanbacteria bacterium]|nr:conserved hypothetical protein [Candidatus Roizmanbacteria bacterium]
MKINPVDYKRLCRVFEKLGWVFVRQKGDHLIYEKQGFTRPVVIPMYRTIPVFIIKNNLRTAKISREEYLLILKS